MPLRLEGFKFGVYVVLPVLAITYFQDPRIFRAIIEKRQYIRYPAEDERKPEDLLRERQEAAAAARGVGGGSAGPASSEPTPRATSPAGRAFPGLVGALFGAGK